MFVRLLGECATSIILLVLFKVFGLAFYECDRERKEREREKERNVPDIFHGSFLTLIYTQNAV